MVIATRKLKLISLHALIVPTRDFATLTLEIANSKFAVNLLSRYDHLFAIAFLLILVFSLVLIKFQVLLMMSFMYLLERV